MTDQSEFRELLDALIDMSQQLKTADERIDALEAELAVTKNAREATPGSIREAAEDVVAAWDQSMPRHAVDAQMAYLRAALERDPLTTGGTTF